jgi:rSAM/selenodomain-associated transferase 2
MNFSFSIVIPVFHESSLINHAINHVKGISAGFESEIIVVDGDPKGSTLECIEHLNIVKIISRKGRGRQMNKGAASATGEILIFLHADTELPDEALAGIASVMDNSEYFGGAFDLGIKSGRRIFRLIEKVVSIRTRLTSVPYGDQAIFIRRKCFEALKGFREIPIMEDIEFMRRMKKSGNRIFVIPQKVNTSPRRWENEGILRCTLRNWALIGLYSLGVKPEKIVRFYYRDWYNG